VAFSQDENGLTFSQVLIVDISYEVVVPEGKVWKVVAILRDNTCTSSCPSKIVVNGVNCILSDSYLYEASYAFPLWLPSGTVVQNGENIERINVIEFNTD
jgi:hypothetical protein